MLKKKPQAFIDVETTGLDPSKHEIIEFAAICGPQRWSFKIQPEHLATAEPEALRVNGFKEEYWLQALSKVQAAEQINQILDGCILIGHNIKFDLSFLNALLQETNVKSKLGRHTVDTVSLAYEHLVPLGLKSLSLKKVCTFLQIPEEPKKHTALNGAECCRRVYRKLERSGWLKRLYWKMINKKADRIVINL